MSMKSAATTAILYAVRRNPNICYTHLEDELARGDISGWLYLPTVLACSFSEWSGAMQAAIDQLRADGARAENDQADADELRYGAQ